MSESPFVIHATQANFTAEVLEKSRQVPVLVDFWAAWCAPCQMLMPVLSKLADEFQGRFLVAKVNSDEEQELAVQYGIRGIPALKLFHQGKVVQEMVGAQPESEIRALLERYIERPADRIRAEALALHRAGESEKAMQRLQKAIEESPTYYPLQEDRIALLIEQGRLDEAARAVEQLPANIQADPSVGALITRINFARVVADSPEPSALEHVLSDDPKNNDARYQLSAHKIMAGEYEEAMEHLLEIMRRDRKFQDDAGRKGLLSVFNLLGNEGPLVSRYRGKMSAMLY